MEIEPGPACVISADADQLEQLLINLLRNAVDAAAETGGEVRIYWTVEEDCLNIFVLDGGRSLSDTANLFVPFFTTKPEGTGIGLPLSRQIAEAHRGSLSLKNRPGGHGCVARLQLPCLLALIAVHDVRRELDPNPSTPNPRGSLSSAKCERVQVVLTRFVHDTQKAVALSFYVAQRDVDLPGSSDAAYPSLDRPSDFCRGLIPRPHPLPTASSFRADLNTEWQLKDEYQNTVLNLPFALAERRLPRPEARMRGRGFRSRPALAWPSTR